MIKKKPKDLESELRKTAQEEKDKGGFNGEVRVRSFDGKPNFSGSIDATKLKHIRILFNPEYEEENPGKSKVVVKYLGRHEVNHSGYIGFQGCPATVDNHVEKIFEPIFEVLKFKDSRFGRQDVHYAANALEDTLSQVSLAKRFELDGQIDFWDDVGKHSSAGRKAFGKEPDKKQFTDYYEAHVRLNLALWGRGKDKKTLDQYYPNSEKARKAVVNFLKRTGISGMTYNTTSGGKQLTVRDREKARSFLTDPDNWEMIARIYAEEFSELMEPGYAMPLSDHSGKGTSGSEDQSQGQEDDGEGQGQKQDKKKGKGKGKDDEQDENEGGEEDKGMPEGEGNQFDREMYSPEYLSKRMREAYENNQAKPNWMSYFKALDLVYKSLAKKLKMKVESFTHQTTIPLFHYGTRPFDPDKDNLRGVSFGLDDEGKMELKKKKWHEDTPLEYKINPKGFPELRFCLLDTSGSMQEDPDGRGNTGKNSIIPWGDNSKYHYALLSWYGLLEYLSANHLLKQSNVMLGNFGDSTEIKQGLEEAKRLAFKPQFGGTNLNLDEVTQMFRGEKMLVFTVSDGEISNWESIKGEFLKYAKKHHYFHLQIGNPNSVTNEMEKAGLHVEYIKSAQDLATKTIDLTDRLYRGRK
ncbi:hypothetical protein JXB28_06480 [Candidatus Woesearchaeota archaeon]|nr:hypothetical protein [Candidatus Woesearchaeota archaeon]